MAFLDGYRRQVALLLRVMPHVAKEDIFALKGGTAINLFVRDLPRLSVDIDLTYLPIEDRATSLATIDAAMLRIGGLRERCALSSEQQGEDEGCRTKQAGGLMDVHAISPEECWQGGRAGAHRHACPTPPGCARQ